MEKSTSAPLFGGERKVQETLAFWGKTFESDVGEEVGYPAVCHMLDVGVVALAIIEQNPPAGALRDKVQLEQASWTAFLVALHDLGKVSPGFQGKQPLLMAVPKKRFPFGKRDEKDHGRVTFQTLRPLLEEKAGCSFELADQLARAVAAHHGSFHQAAQDERDAGDGAWKEAREQVVDTLLDCFGLTWERFPFAVDSCLPNSFVLFLAGLTSVADWLGSDGQRFRYAVRTDRQKPGFSLAVFRDQRLEIARRVVAELNLILPQMPHCRHAFGELFEFEGRPAEPNSTQKAVLGVSAQLDPTAPALVLVETPMGSGKTEAALAVIDQWLANGIAQGLYYALPTRATANAMLGRVVDFLKRAVAEPTQLHLLHASADLQAEYLALFEQDLPEPTPVDIHDEGSAGTQSNVHAGEWFTAKKRGLISPYSVGTVDQALMGVLKQARHFFVRLYGLSGKAVVIDEAHAYDTYTSELLENLLLWLGALRVPVILLSATLPEEKREKLLRAYAPRAVLPSVVEYPCVLAVQPSSDQALYALVPWPDAKAFALEYRELEEELFLDAVEAALRDRLDEGGCALCMTNTVDEAQALYARLAETLDLGEDLHLFHARFPLAQRLEIEERMKRLFGKDPKHRPQRAVLVATQVAEQSLDADFDLLISHLAPIDLLFQRMGRVHRHSNKKRPPKLQKPSVICLAHPLPGESDLADINLNKDRILGQFIRKHFGMSGFVYSPEVLLKTALVLRERATEDAALRVPEDIQPLIAQVYGPEEAACPVHLSELMTTLEDRGWILDATGRRLAKSETLPRPDAPELLLDLGDRTLDEEVLIAQTRLGRPSITVIPLYGDDDGGWFLDLKWQAPVDLEAKPHRSDVDRLIRRGVSIAKPHWVAHFKEQEAPKGWRRSAHLRHARPLKLDREGRYTAGGQVIRMDERLGLVFEA